MTGFSDASQSSESDQKSLGDQVVLRSTKEESMVTKQRGS
jgi:hypothetical protein